MTIWRMACRIPKATYIDSEYVIRTAFSLQQCLHETVLTNLPPSCIVKSGGLNLLEPPGPVIGLCRDCFTLQYAIFATLPHFFSHQQPVFRHPQFVYWAKFYVHPRLWTFRSRPEKWRSTSGRRNNTCTTFSFFFKLKKKQVEIIVKINGYTEEIEGYGVQLYGTWLYFVVFYWGCCVYYISRGGRMSGI